MYRFPVGNCRRLRIQIDIEPQRRPARIDSFAVKLMMQPLGSIRTVSLSVANKDGQLRFGSFFVDVQFPLFLVQLLTLD